VVDQPLPEPGQHRMIESRIGQLQTQGVRPLDPTLHRISSLSITQVFRELQDRDHRQLTRRNPRFPPHSERKSEHGISEQPR
jgi:DNA-binding transcriptional regulator YdaS (Cro superfamily)